MFRLQLISLLIYCLLFWAFGAALEDANGGNSSTSNSSLDTDNSSSLQVVILVYNSTNCSESSLFRNMTGGEGDHENITLPHNSHIGVRMGGLWRIGLFANGRSVLRNAINPIKDMGIKGQCRGLGSWQNTSLSGIKFCGGDGNVSGISLFTLDNLGGNSSSYHDEDVTFSNVSDVRSYCFTGNESWTLFPEPDFKGLGLCFSPDADVKKQGLGVTYNNSLHAVGGSILRGCNPNNDADLRKTTTIPTPVENSTLASDDYQNTTTHSALLPTTNSGIRKYDISCNTVHLLSLLLLLIVQK